MSAQNIFSQKGNNNNIFGATAPSSNPFNVNPTNNADRNNNNNFNNFNPMNRANKPQPEEDFTKVPYKNICLFLLHAPTEPQINITKIQKYFKQLQLGKSDFQFSDNRRKKYEQKYQGLNNLGMNEADMNVPIAPKNRELDLILKQIIKLMCQYTECDQLKALQYLRRYTKQSKFILKRMMKQQSTVRWGEIKLNYNFITALFIKDNNQLKVDKNSQFIQQILSDLLSMFYEDMQRYYECFAILLSKEEITKNRSTIQLSKIFFDKFIKNHGLINSTWAAFEKIVTSFNNKVKDLQDQSEQVNRKLKIKAFLILSKVLYSLIFKYYSKDHAFFDIIPFEKALNLLDDGLVKNMVDPKSVNKYQQILLNFALLLTPFNYIAKNAEDRGAASEGLTTQIKNHISKTKSQQLQPLRMLVGVFHGEAAQRTKISDWQKYCTSGKWRMNSPQWRNWMGIFLDYTMSAILNKQQILECVVYSCKQMISDNEDQFWNGNTLFSKKTKQFIKQFQKQKQLKLVLPILTKALGNSHNQYFKQVVQLIGEDSLKVMIERIRGANSNYENIDEYDNYQVNPIDLQQQIKFLCRIITINPNNLQELQFIITCNRNVGFTILKLLLDTLQIMNDGQIESIKCSRYIINAIDAIFIQGQLVRKVFLYLLGAYQYIQRQKPAMLIKIINVVKGAPKQGYYGIQCKKLRLTLSKHLNTLVRLSETISQYFPCRINKEYAEQYEQLAYYIMNQQQDSQYQWIDKQYPYSTNVWFYQLSFCIKSQQWNPIDYDTVRLLLRKLAIRAEDLQQYQALTYVIQILNKKDIKEIFKVLEPMICSESNIKQKKSRQHKIFRLDNYRYETFLSDETLEISELPQSKYSDKIYVQRKLRKMEHKNRLEIIGKIAGVLDLFHTVLEIKYECLNSVSQYKKFNYLIQKCTVFTYLLRVLTDKSGIYHYKVIEKFSKQKKKFALLKQSLSFLSAQDREETISIDCEINIIQTICSYLHFQLIHQLPADKHSNKLQNRQPVISVSDMQDFAEGYDYSIDCELYDNILNKPANLAYTRDNTIMNSVVNIIKDYLLLGQQQLLRDCIKNRNYFLKSSNLSTTQQQSHAKQLISILVYVLKNQKSSLAIRANILQIFAILISKKSFAFQIVKQVKNIFGFFVFSVDNIEEHELILLDRITNFLLCFTCQYLDSQLIQHSQTVINLSLQILRSIINGFNRFSFSKQQYKGANTYGNLVLQKSINMSTLFKNAIRMLLEIITIILPFGTADSFYQFFDIILSNSPFLLCQGFRSRDQKIYRNQLTEKLNLQQKHKIIIKDTTNGVWLTPNQLHYQHFGRNYQYDIMIAYQRLLSMNFSSYYLVKQKIHELCRINTMLSNLHTFEYSIQSFCVCLLSVLGQSKLAFSFSINICDSNLPKALIKQVKKRRYEYPYSFRDYAIFGGSPQQVWLKLKKLLENILDCLDSNSYETYNRNCLYLVVKAIIEVRKDIMWQTLDPKGNSSQQRGFVKRILFQLSHDQLSYSVYFLVLQSLANAINVASEISYSSLIPHHIVQYLNEMNYVLFQIIDITNNKQIFKSNDLYANLPIICAIAMSIINQHVVGLPEKHPIYQQFQKYINEICLFIIQSLVSLSYSKQKQNCEIFFPYVYNLVGAALQINCLESKVILKTLNLIIFQNSCKKLSDFSQYIKIWQWNTLAKIQCYFSNSETIANIFDYIAIKPKHPQIQGCYQQIKNILMISKSKLNFTYIMQLSSIFQFLIPIFSKDLWTNKYLSNSIEQLLSILLRANFMDGQVFCLPSTKFQIFLNGIKVKEFINEQDEEYFNSQNYEKFNSFKEPFIKQQQRLERSYFQFLWEDSLVKTIRYYLLLIFSGLQNSAALRNFYSKVFTTTEKYTQMIWSDINNNLVKIVNYLVQIVQWMRNPSMLLKMLKLHKYFIKDVDFGIESFMINCLLESDNSIQQWANCMIQTCQIAFDVICLFINIWLENDWKSDLQWQNTLRKDLCKRAKQLYGRIDSISQLNANKSASWKIAKKNLDNIYKKIEEQTKLY